MRFTLHSELRAYPSYGHSPRRRCPDKEGLSVVEFHTVLFAIQGVRNTGGMGENLEYDRLTTSSQRTGFHAQHPVHNGNVTEND